ncbi:MAG TPA: transglutaminase-like domain-containing protein, partial [Woeseiaceae bacterium]|nr:transglutaminase-like domain-containing protein [Woeseiaceae bacterium]
LAQPATDDGTRAALLFQRERMRRILLDFTLDAAAVKARVKRQIPDLTDAEFARWDAQGLFERQVIDGQLLYFNRSPSNLFRLSEEARMRRAEQTPLVDGPMETPNDYHRAVRRAAVAQERPSVLPQRIRVTQSLTVDADAVPAGETVRAWIPFPRVLPGQQESLRLLASTPATHLIAPESSLQRTVYLEKPAQAGTATEFSISYELTIYAHYQPVDPERVEQATITPELQPYASERPPHIVFNESMRLMSEQIVGNETNPWRIAQKLFAAVDEIPWAGAREYSTITNISDYALHAGHADCGQQTLLLMTLLRLNGIPARWQSGMVYSDGDYWNLHDWGWLYIAPYGWMPMDVTFGRFEEAPELEWFYLGGLDAWRIAFNDDYSRPFHPVKQHFRSETVDLQRGEVEWSGGNLYFDQWDYSFDAEVLSRPAGERKKT